MSNQSNNHAFQMTPERKRRAAMLGTAYHFSAWIIIAVIVAIVTISGFGAYVLKPSLQQRDGLVQEACTAEAKLCANGSTVSRTGPQCQFSTCPGQ